MSISTRALIDRSLVLESKCLAKQADGVWLPGTVVEVGQDHHEFKVMLDRDHSVHTVDIAHVVPSQGKLMEICGDLILFIFVLNYL